MKVLVVGAGAVGQVYGYFLQKGGAEVSFYVRPKYVQELSKGLSLYPLNQRKSLSEPELMQGFGLVSTDAEVASKVWDYVILCTPADSVQTPWFASFAPLLGQAILVNLHPDLSARETIARYIPKERTILGMITLISYSAPLPGETAVTPGTAFWVPPLTRIPFQGSAGIVEPLLKVFRLGGFPCRRVRSEQDSGADIFAETLLAVFVLALEGAGWKFDAFLEPSQSALAKQAILEALALQYLRRGRSQPRFIFLRMVLGRFFFRVVLFFCGYLIPFDFETYLRVHFTKIREQGRAGLADALREGRERGVATPGLERLAGQLSS